MSCTPVSRCDAERVLPHSLGRFLYGWISLCERESFMLLTVVISCILSLDVIDCQREINIRSGAMIPAWCKGIVKVDDEFRSLSRFLMVPGKFVIDVTAGLTAESGRTSRLDRHRWRTLGHQDVTCTAWDEQGSDCYWERRKNTNQQKQKQPSCQRQL